MVIIKEESYLSYGEEVPYFTIERDGVLLTTKDQEWEVNRWIEENTLPDESVKVIFK